MIITDDLSLKALEIIDCKGKFSAKGHSPVNGFWIYAAYIRNRQQETPSFVSQLCLPC